MAEPRQAGTKPEEEQQTKADDEKKRRRKAEKGELKAEPGQHVVLVLGGALLLGLRFEPAPGKLPLLSRET